MWSPRDSRIQRPHGLPSSINKSAFDLPEAETIILQDLASEVSRPNGLQRVPHYIKNAVVLIMYPYSTPLSDARLRIILTWLTFQGLSR